MGLNNEQKKTQWTPLDYCAALFHVSVQQFANAPIGVRSSQQKRYWLRRCGKRLFLRLLDQYLVLGCFLRTPDVYDSHRFHHRRHSLVQIWEDRKKLKPTNRLRIDAANAGAFAPRVSAQSLGLLKDE
ncbi:MAG TPA: hypothetical protein P5270_04515 [Victivallales bacterium]|nr:hypothetical protein [Victivallales bacterium]HPO90185.1 hypothetical protein [Victivallales bacterium]HRR28604.1 hypothetical protein [Victivallales bacterium]